MSWVEELKIKNITFQVISIFYTILLNLCLYFIILCLWWIPLEWVIVKCAVHRCDLQGSDQRHDNKWGEGYLEWDHWFCKSRWSLGIDGSLWKWKDNSFESPWRKAKSAHYWWFHHIQWPIIFQVPQEQVKIQQPGLLAWCMFSFQFEDWKSNYRVQTYF